MGKENICEHFHKNSPCGFARWIIEKPNSLMTIPKNGCGKEDPNKCPRITTPKKFPLGQELSNGDSETKIVYPVIHKDDNGKDRHLKVKGIFK